MKYYETPEMEILLLRTEDVITGSLPVSPDDLDPTVPGGDGDGSTDMGDF